MIAKSLENSRYRIDGKKPSTLILLIYFSFGYMGIFLYSPALPAIAQFFNISEGKAQFTMASYLFGYAFSQLFYAPFANRFGRKKAIMFSILFSLFGTGGCILAYHLKSFLLLVIFRLLQAFGMCASVCMTFTVVNDFYYPPDVKKVMSNMVVSIGILAYLLAVWLGGILTDSFGWVSCFWALGIFGIFLFFLVLGLPETSTILDKDAMKPSVALQKYKQLLSIKSLLLFSLNISGLAMLLFYYVSAAPFITHKMLGLSAAAFGSYSILNAVGFTLGGLVARLCLCFCSAHLTAMIGIGFIILGTTSLMLSTIFHFLTPIVFFIPSSLLFLGNAMMFPIISGFAMEKVENKALGAAMMIFIYVLFSFLLLLGMSFVPAVTLMQFSIILICLNVYIWSFYYLGHKYG